MTVGVHFQISKTSFNLVVDACTSMTGERQAKNWQSGNAGKREPSTSGTNELLRRFRGSTVNLAGRPLNIYHISINGKRRETITA